MRLAAFIAVFFLVQIAIDLGHSVTAFPFEHYGMFSESFAQPDSVRGYEIVANGRTLRPDDFRIYQWDMIQQPLAAFDRQNATNDFAVDRLRIQKGLGINSVVLHNSSSVATNFPDWYRSHLSRILGQPVVSLQISRCRYEVKDRRLIPANKTLWIAR